MKALCLVAHPDDCVIFGLGYIHAHAHYQWTVGYLTYCEQDLRAQELSAFWRRREVDTVFLGFEDHWHDNEFKQFTRWQPQHAQQACTDLAQQYDLVLTHGAEGEYGHIHHQLVYQAVSQHRPLVTFAPPGQGTVTHTVPNGFYSLDELPQHKDIVAGFHPHSHINSYKEFV